MTVPTAPIPGPPPPPKKGMSTGMIVLIVVGVLVLVCCGGLAIVAATSSSFQKGFKEGSTPGGAGPVATTGAPVVAPTTLSATRSAAGGGTAGASLSPVPVAMPNVVGLNAAVAQDTLKRAGFTRVELGSQDPGDTIVVLPQNWTVTKQSTAAGQTVPSDTLIVLTCTKQR